jgi:hypothetical protein
MARANISLRGIARAAAKHELPVNILCWDNVDAGAAVIDREVRWMPPDPNDHSKVVEPESD